MFFLLNVHKSFGMAVYTAIDHRKPTSGGEHPCLLEELRHSIFQVLKSQLVFTLCRAYTLHPVHDSVWYLHPPTHTHFWGVSFAQYDRVCLFAFFFFLIRCLHFPVFCLHSSYSDWMQLYGCLPTILTAIQLLHMSCDFWPPWLMAFIYFAILAKVYSSVCVSYQDIAPIIRVMLVIFTGYL